MFNKVVNLYKKYKEIINYLIFGVLTTIVNFIAYFIFANLFSVDEVVSNVIAWFLAVLFAYFTNKIFVFESKTSNIKEILKEIISFFLCRVLSGVFDTGSFAFMIKVMKINDYIAKIITQVFVVVMNYVFSKILIFRKKND